MNFKTNIVDLKIFMKIYFIILFLILGFFNLNAQEFKLKNFQLNKDTIIHVNLFGNLDENNSLKQYFYSGNGFGLNYRIPSFSPVDSIVIFNNDSNTINKLTIISNNTNNFYCPDSLIKTIINPNSHNEIDSIWNIFKFIQDHHYYFYVPDACNQTNESFKTMKHIGVYGYGHCGSINTMQAILSNKIFNKNQREVSLNGSGHSITEINSKYYSDADEAFFPYDNSNNSLLSLGDFENDLWLGGREKAFGSSNIYNYATTAGRTQLWHPDNNRPQYIYHTDSAGFIFPNTNITLNDIMGDELFFTLRPNEKLVLNNGNNNNHNSSNLSCINTIYGSIPSDNDIAFVIKNGDYFLDIINNKINPLYYFNNYSNNLNILSNNSIGKINSNNANFSICQKSTFPFLSLNINFNTINQNFNDSIILYSSFDSINWVPITIITNKINNQNYSLNIDTLIGAHVKNALYKYYIKFEIISTTNLILINKLKINSQIQFSKFLFPSLLLGDNKLKLNANNEIKNLNFQIFYKEDTLNLVPPKSNYPIYPLNFDTINNSNIKFQWQPVFVDAQGDSIQEWYFELSEDSNFNRPVSTNFQTYTSSPIASFEDYYNKYLYNNTFFNNTTYYWHVKCRDANNSWSQWSSTWNFYVKTPMHPLNIKYVLSNKIDLKLTWKNNPYGQIPTSYNLYAYGPASINNFPTTFDWKNQDLTNNEFYPTGIQKTWRIKISALKSGSESTATPIISYPISKSYQFGDTLKIKKYLDSLEKPFPAYPGFYRNYFCLYDTNAFQMIDSYNYICKKTDTTLFNICYTKEKGLDTIYGKQILINTINIINTVKPCFDSNRYIYISKPNSNPTDTLYFTLNGFPISSNYNNIDTLVQPFNTSIYLNFVVSNNDTFFINNIFNNYIPILTSSISTPIYNCDSNKAQINILSTGNAPFTYNYTKDGIAQTLTTSSTTPILYLDNGNYNLQTIQDQTGCIKTINQLQSINYTPLSATIAPPIYNCDSNKTQINITVNGNAPFQLNYIENGINKSKNSTSNSITLYLENGNYNIQNIQDQTGCIKQFNQVYNFNYSAITSSISTPIYNCDSNKAQINILSTGNAPFTYNYTKDGIAQTLTTSSTTPILYLDNGNYNLQTIQDQTGCIKTINQLQSINYTPLSATIAPPIYNCDSNKTQINITVNGNAPFQLNYIENGINKSKNSTSNSITLYLENGNYNIQNIQDQTGCIKQFNQVYNFNYSAITSSISTPIYNCDSNKAQINILSTGNAPFTYNYTKDGIAQTLTTSSTTPILYLDNGNYNLQTIQDQTGCIKTINQLQSINYTPLSATIAPPIYNCDSNKTQINITVNGNAPFQLNYIENGINKSKNSTSNSITLYLENGNYNIQNIQDQTGCIKQFNQVYNFNYSAITSSISTPIYNCDSNKAQINILSTGNAPFTYNYTKDGIAQTLTTSSTTPILYLDNGNYNLQTIQDQTGCIKTINQLQSINYTPLSATIAPPIYNCDSNKTQINITVNGNAPFQLNYIENGINKSKNSTSNSITLYLENGNYNIQNIQDQTGCIKQFNQVYNFNYSAITSSISTPIYNCDSNKAQINILSTGNAPFTYNYTKDGIAQTLTTSSTTPILYLDNGNYNLQTIQDQTGCIKTINQLQSINYTPLSATIAPPIYNCDSNKTQINITVNGNAPFQLNYIENGINKSKNSTSNSITLYLENGNYNIQNIQDQTGCIKQFNQVYNFNYSAITSSISTPIYNCDSNKAQINILSTGNAPFTYNYTKDGIAQTLTTSSTTPILYLDNGNYNLQTIQDQTGCIKTINQLQSINYTPLSATIAPPIYNCDSNKTQINITVNGNAPFQLNYIENGINKSKNSTSNSITLYLENGNYNIQNIQDQTGCIKQFNQVYNFNYSAITSSISTPIYNCDSNKAQINILSTGNAPFTYNYTKDGIAQTLTTSSTTPILYLDNGNYNLQTIQDQTGCIKTINQLQSINYTPLSATIAPPIYNCDSNKTQINITVNGNAPFQLNYIENGINKSKNSTSNSITLYLENGNYNIQNIQDQTGCIKQFNQVYNFNYSAITSSISTPIYNCDSNKAQINILSTGNAPFTYNYTKDGIAQTLTTSSTTPILYLDNGNYNLQTIQDQTGCIKTINQLQSINYTPLSATIAPPIYNCDSNKTQINITVNGNAPFQLNYIENGINKSKNSTSNSITLYLENGNYNIQNIQDQTGCIKQFNQVYNFNYSAITSSISTPIYNCDSNKAQINILSTGNAPFTYNYTKDGIAQTLTTSSTTPILYLDNGNYNLQTIQDQTGCIKTINQLQSINYTPLSATIAPPIYNCDSNKTQINITVNGNAPFQLNYIENGINKSKNSTSNSITLYLENGNYNIQNIQDQTGCIKQFNQVYNFNFDSLNINIDSFNIDCINNNVKYFAKITGNFPINVCILNTKTNIIDTLIFQNSNAQIILYNGIYKIIKLYNYLCNKNFNLNINVDFPKLQSTISPISILCDSANYFVDIKILNGKAPFTFNYYKNSILQNVNLNNTINYRQYLNHSNFIIGTIKDSFGCINQYFENKNLDYNPITNTTVSTQYICAKDSTNIAINILPISNYTLNYASLNNPNGQFIINNRELIYTTNNDEFKFLNVVDKDGCFTSLNNTFKIKNNKISANIFSLDTLCDEKKYQLHLALKGNKPWQLQYIKNNLPDSITLNQDTSIIQLNAGNYYFQNITDSNKCLYQFNQNIDTLLPFTDTVLKINNLNNMIVAPNIIDANYQWYFNDRLVSGNSTNTLQTLGTGKYFLKLIDKIGCQLTSDTIELSYPNKINVFPNPFNNQVNILIDENFDNYWSYQIFDIAGKLIKNGVSMKYLQIIETDDLAKGIYFVKINYSINQKLIYQMVKINK